jgi:hypothetical protein
MRAEGHETYQDPVNHWTLWFGMLGAPGAWALHLVINYALVPAACTVALQFLMYITIPVFIGIAGLAGFFSWRGWHLTRDVSEHGRNGQRLIDNRVRFMALSGLAMSALFLMVIIAQSVPIIIQDPCEAAGSIRI